MNYLAVYAAIYFAILHVGYAFPHSNQDKNTARISVSRKRSTNRINVEVEADNKEFQLELEKMDLPFAKQFSIIQTGKYRREVYIQDSNSLPELYTDKSGESTVLLKEHGDGIFAIEGILNKRYSIAPSGGNQLQHFVFPLQEQNEVSCEGVHLNVTNDEKYSEEPTAAEFIFGGLFSSKSKSPKNLLVELVVVLDYNTSLAFDMDLAKVSNYLSIFYNSVQKIYDQVSEVSIKLEIISVILTQDESEDVIKDWVQPSNTVLKAFGEWIYDKHSDISFDSAMLHTMSDMRGAAGGHLKSSTNGVAFIAQACARNEVGKINYNIGIIEDTPNQYAGIRVAAHELGHILGCTHDGEEPVKSPKHQPSALDCSPKDGYLMSYFPHNENAFYFSPCSLQQLQWFSELRLSQCLQETSSKIDVFAPLGLSTLQSLPGYSISLQEQCETEYGPSAVVYDPNPMPIVCTQLWCRKLGAEGKPSFKGPALEGTQCGNGNVCNLGECVKLSSLAVSKFNS